MYSGLDFSWLPAALVLAAIGLLAIAAGVVYAVVVVLSHVQFI
jgi:hypothetical protein